MQEVKPPPTAPIFFDSYGVLVVECPACQEFIPNVREMQVITCPNPKCKKVFVAILD